MLNESDTSPEARQRNSATYCPEDNKIRLYMLERVERDSYNYLRSIGYKSTPKQDCSFVAPWSVVAEDAAFDLIADDDDVGDEDYSPQERAADRAERFGGYRDKRRGEAHGYADSFDSGPSVFGNQNQGKAERAAKRHDRHRGRALSQWSKAAYWQERTAGVISHAMHKSRPDVRRRRILKLQAEQRKYEKSREKFAKRYAGWQQVASMEGADQLLPLNEDGYAIPAEMNEAQRFAYKLSNYGHLGSFWHPRSEEANEEARRLWHHGFSSCDFLTKSDFVGKPFERFTPKQFAELYLAEVTPPNDQTTDSARYSRHLELRLGYELAMLDNEGGAAFHDTIEPGYVTTGGKYQVTKVNKSAADQRIVSVSIVDTTTWEAADCVNIESLKSGQFVEPTEEQAVEFKAWQAEQKAKTKLANAGKPKLINPTNKDAELLQAMWNAKAEKRHAEKQCHGDFEPAEVAYITQAMYSRCSKGDYGSAGTRTLYEDGRPSRRPSNMWSQGGSDYDKSLGKPACNIRRGDSSGWWSPDRVIVLTDKPQKPIPIDWEPIEREAQPVEDTAVVQKTMFQRTHNDYV